MTRRYAPLCLTEHQNKGDVADREKHSVLSSGKLLRHPGHVGIFSLDGSHHKTGERKGLFFLPRRLHEQQVATGFVKVPLKTIRLSSKSLLRGLRRTSPFAVVVSALQHRASLPYAIVPYIQNGEAEWRRNLPPTDMYKGLASLSFTHRQHGSHNGARRHRHSLTPRVLWPQWPTRGQGRVCIPARCQSPLRGPINEEAYRMRGGISSRNPSKSGCLGLRH